MNPPTEEKTMADLRKWVYKELEPYFQGEFGTMDTMLEMFIEQLTDKLSDLFTEEYLKGFKEGSDLKNFPQLIDTDKIYEKAYDDCAKRFRMREKILKDSFRRKVEKQYAHHAPCQCMNCQLNRGS